MEVQLSGLAPRRRQGGFIQGAILFALVIIAVVVAAFSLANRDNQSSADTEQARVNATFVLKVGNDLQSAINRAIADGLLPAEISTKVKFDASASSSSVLNLFDQDLKYLARPEFPATALATSAVQPFLGTSGGTGATAVFATDKALNNVGGTGKEVIVQVPGLAKAVCQRINTTVNGDLVTGTPPASFANATDISGSNRGWREGCFGVGDTTTPYTYFRAVVTDAS